MLLDQDEVESNDQGSIDNQNRDYLPCIYRQEWYGRGGEDESKSPRMRAQRRKKVLTSHEFIVEAFPCTFVLLLLILKLYNNLPLFCQLIRHCLDFHTLSLPSLFNNFVRFSILKFIHPSEIVLERGVCLLCDEKILCVRNSFLMTILDKIGAFWVDN